MICPSLSRAAAAPRTLTYAAHQAGALVQYLLSLFASGAECRK